MKQLILLFILLLGAARTWAQPAFPADSGLSEEARQRIEELRRQRMQELQAQQAQEAQPGQIQPNQAQPGAPGQQQQQPPTGVPGFPQLPPPNAGQNNTQPLPQPGQPAATGQGGDRLLTDAQADEPIDVSMLSFDGGATIDQLLDVYSLLVNRVVLKPATLPAPPNVSLNINIPLTRREAVQALDTYLALNGITVIPMGDKFLTVVPSAQAFQEGAEFSNVPLDQLPEAGSYVTHIEQLQYVPPSELVPVLQQFAKAPNSIVAIDSSMTLVLRDNSVNVKRMLEVVERVDISTPPEFETELIPVKYALASEIANVLSSLSTGGGAITAGGGTTAGGVTGGASGFGGGGGFNQSGSQFNQFNSGYGGSNYGGSRSIRPYQAATGATAGQRTGFQNRLRQIISNAAGEGEVQVLGETKIVADERTNSMLVFAKREDMDTIKDIIAKMDVVLAQVLIEAIIMEVNLGENQNISVSAGVRSEDGNNQTASLMNNGLGFLNFSGSTNISNFGTNLPSGFSWFGQFGDDFAAALNAVASDNRLKVLSRPSVQTSHAVPANLFVGETRPYITGTFFDSFGGGASRSQYQQTQIGISLQVLPLINPEGLVVMDINQQIQQIGGSVNIDGNEVPITQDTMASAKVAVRDRDTVILGGFIRNSIDRGKSGVPFLKDIPILGWAFRSNRKDDQRRELIVLIKPTVLPTPLDAARLVNDRRDTTPILKEAEVDFEMEEQRLLEKANEDIMKKRLGLPED